MAGAKRQRAFARRNKIVDYFPIRHGELTVLEAALRADEKDGFAAYLLACQLYNARVYDRAASLWEAAIKYEPDFYIPYRNLALVYDNHLGRTEDAIALLCRALELKPGDPMLLSELASVMARSSRPAAESAAFLTASMPEIPNDQIMLAIANSYNAAFMFDEAEQTMRSHTFAPAEGEEVIVATPYMYSCLCRGRTAMKEGRYEDALDMFRRATSIPENLNAAFWNESVLIPYRYNEAAALKALGRDDEAREIIGALVKQKDVGMWNMGGEFVYYSAMSVRLGGAEMRARSIMRDAVLAWERELAGGCKYYRQISKLFGCFMGDHTALRLAELYGMLGYGKLFDGDKEGARNLFRRSMEISPSGKIAFELHLLEN